ncbi:hypothetical protein, partial [Streptomyces sp. URMC 123]|uniref:hypothetical protein n=1 Tax=Streptomyces sp. URMC 123 TaxID=3423403 RepID=UPI003F1CA6D2
MDPDLVFLGHVNTVPAVQLRTDLPMPVPVLVVDALSEPGDRHGGSAGVRTVAVGEHDDALPHAPAAEGRTATERQLLQDVTVTARAKALSLIH